MNCRERARSARSSSKSNVRCRSLQHPQPRLAVVGAERCQLALDSSARVAQETGKRLELLCCWECIREAKRDESWCRGTATHRRESTASGDRRGGECQHSIWRRSPHISGTLPGEGSRGTRHILTHSATLGRPGPSYSRHNTIRWRHNAAMRQGS